MGSYLQQYGVEEQKRGRIIKWIVVSFTAAVILALGGYFFYHNYPEKQVVKHFLGEVNSQNYKSAYADWGCTAQHPCRNYDFNRFLQDWGPDKKAQSPWKIASVDGCKSFVTVNVQAAGTELESLAVQRSDSSLGYAPSPECQERQWRWGQFFHRIFSRGS